MHIVTERAEEIVVVGDELGGHWASWVNEVVWRSLALVMA